MEVEKGGTTGKDVQKTEKKTETDKVQLVPNRRFQNELTVHPNDYRFLADEQIYVNKSLVDKDDVRQRRQKQTKTNWFQTGA